MKLFSLDDRRGALTDWTTQQWVKATGRRVDLQELPWLDGPVGEPEGIGASFFERWADRQGYELERDRTPRGLLPTLELLRSEDFDPDRVQPLVRRFYEATSDFEMDAWSEWAGAFRPFGWLLSTIFSQRLGQLNVPMRPLDTSMGTTSDVIHLVDPGTGDQLFAAWIRQLQSSGQVLYAGSYSICRVPGLQSPCVRVVFPLPNGNAIVILRPEVDSEGVLTVISDGRSFGDPGFYFTVHGPKTVWARYVRTMKEDIRVFPGRGDEVRADHTMRIWGRVFLRLHYRLRLQEMGADAG